MKDIVVDSWADHQRTNRLRDIALHILSEQLARFEKDKPPLATLGPDDLLFVQELFYCRAAQEGLAASIRDESALKGIENHFIGRKLDDATECLEWLLDGQLPAIEAGALAATSDAPTSPRKVLEAQLAICRHLAVSTGRLRAIISQGKARTYPAEPLVLVEGLTSPLDDIVREQLALRSEWSGVNGVGDCWGRAHGMTLDGAARLSQTVGGKIDTSLNWKGIAEDGALLQAKRLQMSLMTASELAEELILANPKISRRMAGSEGQEGQNGKEDVGVWCHKSRQQFRSAARLMTKFLGSVPLVRASHQDFVAFYKILLTLPADHHTRRGDECLTLEQLAARADGGGEGESSQAMKPVTARRHLNNLRMLLSWLGTAFNLPVVKWEYLISWSGRDGIQDRYLSVEDVRSIFELPIWTGCKRYRGTPQDGDTVWHGAAYWVPILLWYTGVGRDGICAFELCDIVQAGKHYCVRVRPGLGGVVEDRGFERLVPLHPEIIRLGFVDYVDALRAEGETLLFPELRRASQQLAADVYSSRYWRPLKTALPEGKANFGPGAIRDAAQKALKDLKVPEDKRKDLAGLRGKTQIDICYSKITPVEHLAVIVMKIPNVTAHIEARRINLIPVEARAPSSARIVSRVQDRLDQEHALTSILEGKSAKRTGI